MYFCSIYDLFSCVHNHHYLVLVLSDLGIPEDNQSDIVQDTVGTSKSAEKTNLPKLQTVTNNCLFRAILDPRAQTVRRRIDELSNKH